MGVGFFVASAENQRSRTRLHKKTLDRGRVKKKGRVGTRCKNSWRSLFQAGIKLCVAWAGKIRLRCLGRGYPAWRPAERKSGGDNSRVIWGNATLIGQTLGGMANPLNGVPGRQKSALPKKTTEEIGKRTSSRKRGHVPCSKGGHHD